MTFTMRAGTFMTGRRQKHTSSRILTLAIFVILTAVFCVPHASPALAQERVQHRSIFELFFGAFRKQPPAPPAGVSQPDKKRKAPARKRQSSITVIDTQNAAQPAAKLDVAKHILVVGDFMASSLGDGLAQAFQDTPGVVVDERTNGSSGLVRNDYYDWLAQLPPILDEMKPALLIIEIGSNDRQKMALDGNKEEFHSPAWTAEYERRVEELVGIAVKRNIPVLWTGIPSFQSASFTADIVAINLILRRQAEKAGATFVDIWEGFVDENGKFSATGSDVDGQPARLRGSDGINLTKAGKAKIAFYVEKYARRLLGDAALAATPGVPASATPTDLGLPEIRMPDAPQNHVIVRTEPMNLNDPAFDGGSALAARSDRPAMLSESPRDRLVLRGNPGIAPAGRVDDFKIKKN
jgi:uncharacterized protein